MNLPSRSAWLLLVSVGLAIFAGELRAFGQDSTLAPSPSVKPPSVSSPTTLGTIRDQQDELKARFDQVEKQLQANLSRQEKAIERLTEQVAKLEAELRAARDPRQAKLIPLNLAPQAPAHPVPFTPSPAGQP